MGGKKVLPVSSKKLRKDPVQAGPEKARKPSRVRVIIGIVCLLLVSGSSFMFGSMEAGHQKPDATAPADKLQLPAQGRRMLKPGPWGELRAIPMSIAPPDELLHVSQIEALATHWFFKGFSRGSLANLFNSLNLPDDQRDKLLDSSCLHSRSDGMELTPPNEAVLSLPSKARQILYELLCSFPENRQEFSFFDSTLLERNFREDGVSRQHMELFRKLSCTHGESLIFSGYPCLLSQVSRLEDKCRVFRALFRQDTLLLRLHVTPGSDIKALAEYWGRGATTADVEALLSSLQRIPGGTWANIALFLPARPAGLLYTFAHPQNPANGPPMIMDCHWTSFNFFQEPFERGYANDQIDAVLKSNYAPIEGNPRYGDLALFMDSSVTALHSAIFVADDILYTKNGANSLQPWILTTVSDVLRTYAGLAKPGQALKIVYFRQRKV